ncbi:MAG: DUF4045 domain-containing protein, partial [Oxalobacteraceae bacterium]
SKPSALSSRVTEKEPAKPAALKSSVLSTAPTLPPKPQASDSLDTTASSSPRFPALKSPEMRSGEFKSPELKQETTPKTDFRSGLKSRSGTIGAQTQQEPEFKALFGKLKKAQTEKYVAPDELKSNILRGKAGLSLSAGPQKTERRDELKESLLKKKEEMNKAAVEKPAPEPKISPAPSSVPEALSIRKQLGRSNSTLNVPAPAKSHRDITPEALSFHKNLRGKPKAPEKRSSVTEKVELKRASLEAKPSVVASDEKPAEEAPTALKSEEKPEPKKQELPEPEKRELPKPATQELPKPVQQEPSKPQVQTRPMSNKIADRFNPALAGLLARGPPSTRPRPRRGRASARRPCRTARSPAPARARTARACSCHTGDAWRRRASGYWTASAFLLRSRGRGRLGFRRGERARDLGEPLSHLGSRNVARHERHVARVTTNVGDAERGREGREARRVVGAVADEGVARARGPRVFAARHEITHDATRLVVRVEG